MGLSANHQKLGRGMEQTLPHGSVRNPVLVSLHFGLLAFRTVKQMYLSHRFVARWYGSLEKHTPLLSLCLLGEVIAMDWLVQYTY